MTLVLVTTGPGGVMVTVAPGRKFTPVSRIGTPMVPDVSAGGVALVISGGCGMTVRERFAVRVPVISGAVALNVPIDVPGAAVPPGLIVTSCEAPARSEKDAGVNVIDGSTGAVTLSVPANPLIPVAVTVTVAVDPACTLIAGGMTVIAASGGSATVATRTAVVSTPAALSTTRTIRVRGPGVTPVDLTLTGSDCGGGNGGDESVAGVTSMSGGVDTHESDGVPS